MEAAFTDAPLPWDLTLAMIREKYGYTSEEMDNEDLGRLLKDFSMLAVYENTRAKRKIM